MTPAGRRASAGGTPALPGATCTTARLLLVSSPHFSASPPRSTRAPSPSAPSPSTPSPRSRRANTINGWACYNYDYTRYAGASLGGGPQTSYLFRYSLDRIPTGMRITHAEWTIAHNISSAHVNVWRLLAEWGLGVCYDYRMTYPKKVEWSVAGAKGKSTDRATNPTATGQFVNGQLLNVNVTQDVEMWYSGAAPNRGWLITFDAFALLHSAVHDGHRPKWQLVITYEPE